MCTLQWQDFPSVMTTSQIFIQTSYTRQNPLLPHTLYVVLVPDTALKGISVNLKQFQNP